MPATRRGHTAKPTASKTFAQLTKPQLIKLATFLGVQATTQQKVVNICSAVLPVLEQAQRDQVENIDFARILPARGSPDPDKDERTGDEDQQEEESDGGKWGGIAQGTGQTIRQQHVNMDRQESALQLSRSRAAARVLQRSGWTLALAQAGERWNQRVSRPEMSNNDAEDIAGKVDC
jgi:hypothetical protein